MYAWECCLSFGMGFTYRTEASCKQRFFLAPIFHTGFGDRASPEEILECSFSTADGTSMDVILGELSKAEAKAFFSETDKDGKSGTVNLDGPLGNVLENITLALQKLTSDQDDLQQQTRALIPKVKLTSEEMWESNLFLRPPTIRDKNEAKW